MSPEIKAFFDDATNTITFLIKEPNGPKCAIIDTVLDFDFNTGLTDTASADKIIAYVKHHELQMEWILESHVHADHLSAAPYIQEQLGGKIGIGEFIKSIQDTFGKIFNEGTRFQRDGSQFDALFKDKDRITIGGLHCNIMHTPGHTPACLTYVIGDAAFVGDTLFMPDFGTARADFPGGSAADLYDSIQKILALPANTRIFVGHDYKAPGRDTYAWETTVAEQRQQNVHVGKGHSRQDFIATRNNRDSQLAAPRLIVPSLQVNMRAGHLPEPEDDGNSYIKMPIKRLTK